VAYLARHLDPSGIYFWEDFVDGAPPYFSVPAAGIEDLNDPVRMWPFNDVGYTLFPILNLAVGGSGGGDPASGSYPAENAGRLGARLLRPSWSGDAPHPGAWLYNHVCESWPRGILPSRAVPAF
jgi:hypothetical protein